MKIKCFAVLCGFWLSCLLTPAFPDTSNPLKPPLESDVVIAKKIISDMSKNPRGPYTRINWYCNDGSVLPPKAYACAERGGGLQHAAYSESRILLAEMGWHVGTIYSALSWDEFWDESNRHARMRQLPFERYLVDIEDGWVMRKARYYRGHVQIEDEARVGQELLLALMEKESWIAENFFLLRELVRVVPHDGGSDLTRMVRRASQDIAEQDASFEPIRIELHTMPSEKSASVIRTWIESNSQNPEKEKLLTLAEDLANQIDQLYGKEGRSTRLEELAQRLQKNAQLKSLSSYLVPPPQESNLASIGRLSSLLSLIRQKTLENISAQSKLVLFDSIPDLEAELRIKASQQLQNTSFKRKALLRLSRDLIIASYGGGFLSINEQNSLIAQLDEVLSAEQVSLESYLKLSRSLSLVGNWAVGSLRHAFAEPLVLYVSINPRSANFIDDLLRTSPILQLAEATRQIAYDAQTVAGVEKHLFNQKVPGVLVLNPGVAIGRLQIISDADLASGRPLSKDDIVVLPQTVSELSPVAGVLTQGEGNILSHVQLLARNFGIPNISISHSITQTLQPFNGQEVVLIAGSDGSVMMQPLAMLSEKTKALVLKSSMAGKLTVPKIDASVSEPVNLVGLSKSLSGKVVGPKAANLGELNKLFPGRVAPAMALPFGLFLNEVNLNEKTNWKNLAGHYESFRQKKITDEVLNKNIQDLNAEIKAIKISNNLRATLQEKMQEVFGEAGSYGVFIRSDTNVEDLPGFTGAGLSETLPNIVGFENQLQAIPKVWASVLAPRAIAWRSNLLTNPERVFPSVLLMKSVNADKSGVLITADLVNRNSGLTVSTAWGVGGAVAGEAAETLVLADNGTEQLISDAKVAYKRNLPNKGGIQWLPAPIGSVLTQHEKQALRELAKEVKEKYQAALDDDGLPMPWDIEFGFVSGELTLFQIRPLVERGPGKADRFLAAQQIQKPVQSVTIELNKLANIFKNNVN